LSVSKRLQSDTPAAPYRKRAIPNKERRRLAERHGASWGSGVSVSCHYCGARGSIQWHQSRCWPVFTLEIDHVVPEFRGGANVAENFVFACQRCNRSKGHSRSAPQRGKGACA